MFTTSVYFSLRPSLNAVHKILLYSFSSCVVVLFSLLLKILLYVSNNSKPNFYNSYLSAENHHDYYYILYQKTLFKTCHLLVFMKMNISWSTSISSWQFDFLISEILYLHRYLNPASSLNIAFVNTSQKV